VIGFLAAFGLTFLLALNGGGYDVVVRHEVAIVIWAGIGVGLAVGFLPRARLTPASWLALGGFIALAVLMAVAHSWTESDERTSAEMARALQYLGVIALAYLALNRYTWQGAAAGFATAALAVPFLALGSRLFPELLVGDVRAFEPDRLSYPLDYWNGVSCWGAMAAAVGLCLSAHAARLAVRALALASVPVAALSVFLTYSRFGVAAVAIAVLAAVALSRNRWTVSLNAAVAAGASGAAILVAHGQDEIANATGDAGAGAVILVLVLGGVVCAITAALGRRLDRVRLRIETARIALAGAVVLAVLAAVAAHGPISDAWDDFKNQRTVATGSDSVSRLGSFGGNRYGLWTSAVDAFQTDPSRGIGPGSFDFYWSREGTGSQFIRNPHSLYLQQLAELGVFGLVAVVAGLAGLLAAAIGARRRWLRDRDLACGTGLIAAFVVFLAYAGIDWMWELGAVGALALGGAAVAGAGGLERARPWDLGPWLRAGLVMVALVAAAAQVPSLVSVQRTRASSTELADGNLDRARELADQAIEAESWAASPYSARALVFEAQGDLVQARRDIDVAAEREPTNWRNPLIAARIDARAGKQELVAADLAQAKRLAPRSLYLTEGSPYLLGIQQLLSGSRPGPGP
jgi:hypothetical protein